MNKWATIIVFNIVFAFAAGFITSRVFHTRDGGRWYLIDKEDRRMILCVALASILAAALVMTFSTKHVAWWISGICFGNAVPVLTFFFRYVAGQYDELILRPKPGIILDTKIKLITALYYSFNSTEFFVLSFFTLLYGWISLLVPGLGLIWGYMTYHHHTAQIKIF
jgi:hypothetical protein